MVIGRARGEWERANDDDGAACGGGLESRFGDALRLQLVVLHYEVNERERERAGEIYEWPAVAGCTRLSLSTIGSCRGWVSSVLPDGQI